MKHFLLSTLLAGSLLTGHTQRLQTWLEQLAALQSLQQTIHEGYQLVESGLNTIGDLKTAEYQLHSDYYHSLKMVNPKLLTYAQNTFGNGADDGLRNSTAAIYPGSYRTAGHRRAKIKYYAIDAERDPAGL